MEQAFRLKSGDYLSSRRLTASTFGVKELNFCVRNGNRWVLFAIITAIAIYLRKLPAFPLSAYVYIYEFLFPHTSFSTLFPRLCLFLYTVNLLLED